MQHVKSSRVAINRSSARGFIVTLVTALVLVSTHFALAQTRNELLLGPDDVIELMVTNHPTLNRTITIRPDGKITVPRAGDVQAAGRTSQALAADIQERLKSRLNNARVTIAVKEVNSQRVRVLGAVNQSGSFQLKPNWRFMDLVVVAGGLKTKPTRVTGRIVRDGSIIPLDVEAAVKHPESRANTLLQNNDLIVLDERDIFKQINVIGEVVKPGAYDLTEDLSVITLLNDAGGATEQAALKRAYVQRAGARIPLDLFALLVERRPDAEATKFEFEIGDVLVLPENEARFSVMGQVTKPGSYRLPEKREEATALRALAIAGNPLNNADLRNVTITRYVDGQPTTRTVDLQSQRMGRAPDNTFLEEGDSIVIPQRQLHVTGQVNKPGAYDISDDLSVVELMAKVGNPLPGAGLSKSYVMRDGEQIPLNLYNVLSDASVTNFKFENGDVLVIPDVQNQLIVLGQVANPGSYDLDDDVSVISLVTKAGGALPNAALKKTYVLRQGKQVPLDLHATLVERKFDPAAANFEFQAGDVLVFPENQSRYAVMGQVKKAGHYPVPEDQSDVTVLEALVAAGGAASDAELSNAGIIRTVNGEAKRIPLDLENMLTKGDNLGTPVRLQPDDVLFIPSKKPNSPSKWSRILSVLPFVRIFTGGF